MDFLSMFRNKKQEDFVAVLLADPKVREDLLGVGVAQLPAPQQILEDASKILRYSQSQDYRMFQKEVWARVLSHLDAIQNDKSTADQVNFHRGALKASLDILRIAAQARVTRDMLEKETQSATLPR